MSQKKNRYNRVWEQKNNVYNICITTREEDFSKQDLAYLKTELKKKDMSVSNFVIQELSKCVKELKGE